MPRLKLMVESAIHGYLTDQLTDEGFKESILSILNEFKGKNLLHQNIGQLTSRMEKENSSVCAKRKFEKIWILFDQVSPRIRKDFYRRMRKVKR
jgi:hypothetical protein